MKRRLLACALGGLLAAAAAGCRSRPDPDRAEAPPARARSSRLPPVARPGTEGLPPLTDAGLLALRVLEQAEFFTGDAVGEGGDVPVECEAMRVLYRERAAAAAFRTLLERGSRAGRVFALCGLWYADPEAYRTEADRLVAEEGDEPVRTFFGCLIGERRLADLVRHPGPGPAVRLRDRGQTIREWREENPVEDANYDVEGGAFPCLLRCGGGWPTGEE